MQWGNLKAVLSDDEKAGRLENEMGGNSVA